MIRPEDVKALREQTGAGIMDCKRALEESGGDVAQAVARLKEKGLSTAAKKADREVREGVVASYIHHGARLGVLLELNCETDFVARTDDFQQLARELAMQVAGLSPSWVSRDDVPAAVLAEREEFAAEAERDGRPADRVEQIVDGKLNKWLESVCLLEMPFRDTEQRVSDLVSEKIALLGENIRVARFARMAVGETAERDDREAARLTDPATEVARLPHRVPPKLSGEALMGDRQLGIDPEVVRGIAAQVADARRDGIEVAVVVGGGNIFRGVAAAASGMDRATADYMGMLATAMNGLALQDALEQAGCPTRVMSAIAMNEIAEPYIRRRAVRHLEKDAWSSRGRDREPVLHHRHGGNAAGGRAGGRGDPQGDAGGRRMMPTRRSIRERPASRGSAIRSCWPAGSRRSTARP